MNQFFGLKVETSNNGPWAGSLKCHRKPCNGGEISPSEWSIIINKVHERSDLGVHDPFSLEFSKQFVIIRIADVDSIPYLDSLYWQIVREQKDIKVFLELANGP